MRAAILVFMLSLAGVAHADGDTTPSPADLRKTCVDAMNANPSFAKDIVTAADKQADDKRLALDKEAGERRAQQDDDARTQRTLTIAKDERQVIMAYAAMWIVAAAFVLFLWLKQSGLKAEILRLRRDLEAATKDAK